jgi:hypothetical protein
MKPMSRSARLDRRSLKLNRPPEREAFCWFTQEMLGSHAFRAMSRPAFLVLMRLCLEHMAHAGTDNGRLPVTQRQFAQYGVRKQSVPGAIAELEALGFAKRTDTGRKSFGEFEGRAARFRLTWLPVLTSGDIQYATNEWGRFSDLKSARRAILEVRRRRDANRAKRKIPRGDEQYTRALATERS